MSALQELPVAQQIAALEAERDARIQAYLEELAIRPDGLPEFVQLLWSEAQPGTTLIWGDYLQTICEKLLRFLADPITTELVVNIPPRTGKSTLIGTLLPAWLWLQDPARQFLCITKVQNNARRDARAMRRVITSATYQRLCALADVAVQLAADQNTVDYFATDCGGHRISTTTEGSVIGVGAHLELIDDPHGPEDMLGSPEQVLRRLERVHTDYREKWTPRLNPGSSPPSKRIIVMQRLHEADLAGQRLAAGADRLILPMRAEEAPRCAEDTRSPGVLLVPAERFTAGDEARARQNPMVWAGQMQQRPVNREGGLFKAAWFANRYSTLPPLAGLLLSIDATFKDTRASDYVTIGRWGRLQATTGAALLHQVRQRMDYPALRAAVLAEVNSCRQLHPSLPLVVLIEDKANGSALIADLRREVPGVVPFNPGSKSKFERAQVGAVPWLQAGQVLLPEEHSASFNVGAYIAEHLSFPNAAHDDQVDQTSQALIYMAQHPLNTGGVRHGGSRRDLGEARGRHHRGHRRGGW